MQRHLRRSPADTACILGVALDRRHCVSSVQCLRIWTKVNPKLTTYLQVCISCMRLHDDDAIVRACVPLCVRVCACACVPILASSRLVGLPRPPSPPLHSQFLRAAVWMSRSLIVQYLGFPTTTSVDLSAMPAATMPWITVCNLNSFRLDAVLSDPSFLASGNHGNKPANCRKCCTSKHLAPTFLAYHAQ